MLTALLDRYIDRMRRSTFMLGGGVGPFSRIGSIINVAFCAVMGVGGTIAVFSGNSPLFFFPLIVLFLEVVFVRIAFRAHRGDFEQR